MTCLGADWTYIFYGKRDDISKLVFSRSWLGWQAFWFIVLVVYHAANSARQIYLTVLLEPLTLWQYFSTIPALSISVLSSSNSISGFKTLIQSFKSEVFMKVTLGNHFLNHNSERQRYRASWTDNCLAGINACESFHMASLVFNAFLFHLLPV